MTVVHHRPATAASDLGLFVRRFLADYARNPVNLLVLVLVPVVFVVVAAGSMAAAAKLLGGIGPSVETAAGWAAGFLAGIAMYFQTSLVHAAQAAGVHRVVFSGVYHPSLSLVNHADTRPIEEAHYNSDLEFTVLQPAMFMQGLLGGWTSAVRDGVFAMPYSKGSAMTFVDYRDVAEVAAIAFASDELVNGTFELAAGGMVS